MAWINLFIMLTFAAAADLPRFLTKHPMDSLRFVSNDGRYAYLKKRPGVLALVTNFRSEDFLSVDSRSDFQLKASRHRRKLVLEVIPHMHDELNLFKPNNILALDWGSTKPREIGSGLGAKLHLMDEWVSYYRPYLRTLTVHNLLTDKKFDVELPKSTSPYFRPEVEMITGEALIYTAVGEKGTSAVIQHNLSTGKASIIYQSQRPGLKLELCQRSDYLAVGEFALDGIRHKGKIMSVKLGSTVNLMSLETIYHSTLPDYGNILCTDQNIYFIKTANYVKKYDYRRTEIAKIDLRSRKVSTVQAGNFTQIIEMDGRVLAPLRGEFFVIEGKSDISEDVFKALPKKEEQVEL